MENARASGLSEEAVQRTLSQTPTQRMVWVADTDAQAERECRAMLERFSELARAYTVPGDA